MSNTNKTTKRQMFEAIKAVEGVASNPEMVKFINHEIELLEKRNKNKVNKALASLNEELKEDIRTTLNGQGTPLTISEIQNLNNKLGSYSNQKITALVRQLVEANEVEKVVDKKTSRFILK